MYSEVSSARQASCCWAFAASRELGRAEFCAELCIVLLYSVQSVNVQCAVCSVLCVVCVVQ